MVLMWLSYMSINVCELCPASISMTSPMSAWLYITHTFVTYVLHPNTVLHMATDAVICGPDPPEQMLLPGKIGH